MSIRKRKDPAWRHYTIASEDDKPVGTCMYCHVAKYVSNVSRMKEHLGKCSAAPDSVRRQYEGFDSQGGKQKNSKAVFQGPPASGSVTNQNENIAPSGAAQVPIDLESSSPPVMPNKSKKSARLDTYVDHITAKESAAIDRALAQFTYAEGLPFRIVESPYFRSMMQILRPSYVPPSRHLLGNSLLNAESARVDAQRAESLQNASDLSLFTDGWSGVDNRSLINFLVGCPKPVFLKSIDTGSNAHTATYIAAQIREVIENLGSDRVKAVVSDNAANMRAAWRIIVAIFIHIICYGCSAHGVNLTMKDLLRIDEITVFFNDVKIVAKFFVYKIRPAALLRQKSRELYGKEMMLCNATGTRWGIAYCISSNILRRN